MNDNSKIAFLGAGRMATALAGGLTGNGFPTDQIAAYDTDPKSAEKFKAATGAPAFTDSREKLFDISDIIVIAVKPQYLKTALAGLKIKSKLIISIVAGVKLATLHELTGSSRVIRVMPNTPALVRAGISAYSPSEQISRQDIENTEFILKSVGRCCRLEESLMDAVTGLSGSGPAYVFDFIQALADGGVKEGLPRNEAILLAAQTVAGAAQMVLQTGQHPAVLRDQVTSPGGTTASALAVLEKGAFRGLVADAVSAAAKRSAELGSK